MKIKNWNWGLATAFIFSMMAFTSVGALASAPSGLSYNPWVIQITQNQPMKPALMSNTGGAPTAIYVSPALPAGLSIDQTTGTISGTPTTVSAAKTYGLGVVNSSGSGWASISIQVVAAPSPSPSPKPTSTTGAPSGLNYNPWVIHITQNQPMKPALMSNTGGAPTSIYVSPALPPGLSINQTNGTISGTPTLVSAAKTYGIAAFNSSGNSWASISIQVVASASPSPSPKPSATPSHSPSPSPSVTPSPKPSPSVKPSSSPSPVPSVSPSSSPKPAPTATAAPSNLSYSPNPLVLTQNLPISPLVPSVKNGAGAVYYISPLPPVGLYMDPSTGIITGQGVNAQPSTEYIISANNQYGSSVTTIHVTVTASNLPPPPPPVIPPISDVVNLCDHFGSNPMCHPLPAVKNVSTHSAAWTQMLFGQTYSNMFGPFNVSVSSNPFTDSNDGSEPEVTLKAGDPSIPQKIECNAVAWGPTLCTQTHMQGAVVDVPPNMEPSGSSDHHFSINNFILQATIDFWLAPLPGLPGATMIVGGAGTCYWGSDGTGCSGSTATNISTGLGDVQPQYVQAAESDPHGVLPWAISSAALCADSSYNAGYLHSNPGQGWVYPATSSDGGNTDWYPACKAFAGPYGRPPEGARWFIDMTDDQINATNNLPYVKVILRTLDAEHYGGTITDSNWEFAAGLSPSTNGRPIHAWDFAAKEAGFRTDYDYTLPITNNGIDLIHDIKICPNGDCTFTTTP